MQSSSKLEIAKKVLNKSISKLTQILTERGVPESHGMGHCSKVLEHMNKTLESSESAFACTYHFEFSEEKSLSMKLGALLHDADDRKYFAEGS